MVALVGCTLLASCFKEEPLNAECDIETASVHVQSPEKMFFSLTDTTQRVLSISDSIGFSVRREADLTALSPSFTLTPGATIQPANRSTHDFSKGAVAYTVTSEDGAWHRQYKVAFVPKTQTVNDTIVFDFENYSLASNKPGAKDKYYTWDTSSETGLSVDKWASGNPGFVFTQQSSTPEGYPTVPATDGYEGSSVRLITKDTGVFGVMGNMRIAAGNLFLGTFDPSLAMSGPTGALKATSFGVAFDKKPTRISGYYKYKPGEHFQDRSGNIQEAQTDKADIYSVVYRNHDSDGNAVTLNGENVLNSPQVVAIARVDNVTSTDSWTRFDVDYTYLNDIDTDLLQNFGYSIAIVFTSSANGAYFEGAVGSTLDIDKVEVVCEKTE